MNPFHSLTDDQLAEWHRLTVRCEKLELDLAESRKATESVQRALILEQSHSHARLLKVYVAAVKRLLDAMEAANANKTHRTVEYVGECFAEVWQLTELHLTPSALQPGA